MKVKLLATLVFGCMPTIVLAGALEDLEHFLTTTKSASGNFEQRVFSDKGENLEGRGTGNFKFLRPGCFSWHYEAPFEEVMMSDGKTLWLYDVEMGQVTVKKLVESLPATPASILFGSNDFKKDFDIKELPSKSTQNWLVALPKDNNSPFSEIRIAFKEQLPVEMVLKDNFGQTTELKFSEVQGNVKAQAKDFQFKIPKGVEILEDRSNF